jgi:hypothetical protein
VGKAHDAEGGLPLRALGKREAADRDESLCVLPHDKDSSHRDVWFFGPLREDGKLDRIEGMLPIVRDCPEGKDQMASVWYEDPQGVRMRFQEGRERDQNY